MPQQSRDRPAEAQGEVILLVRDLIMQSRVAGVAKRLEIPVAVVRSPDQLSPERAARLLIVDLDLEGALAASTAWAAATGGRAAGFVQHVHVERIREAKQAGIDPIIPRSRLDAVLPELLRA